jgi:dynactin 6
MPSDPSHSSSVATAASGGGAKGRQQHAISKDANVIAGPLKHEITLGQGCVLHPFATVDATNGPLHIGDYCIIEEGAEIVVPPPLAQGSSDAGSSSSTTAVGEGTVIGSHNRFGPRCRVESSRVGSGNVFCAHSSAGMMSTIGDHCILAARARITHDVVLPTETRVLATGLWVPRTGEVDQQAERDECLRLSRYFRSGHFS